MEHETAPDSGLTQRFETTVLPHLDAAYNLARWLTRSEHDAQDIVQEACLRAFKFFGGFRGGNSRSWLLTIVRNTAYSWLEKNRKHEFAVPLDDQAHDVPDESPGPEALHLKHADRDMVRSAIEQLPLEFREAIILRELEGLAYRDIADVAGVPIGTVMSRLVRARKLLQDSLTRSLESGGAA